MIQNEVNQFSERVQRCVRDCQDGVRDRFGELNQDNLSKAQEYMDKCSNACVDKHVAMLKSIESRLEKDIADKTKGLV